MEQLGLKTIAPVMSALIDGKTIQYSSDTVFYVQTGRNKKSRYTTKYKIVGNINQAAFWYIGINIGNGYKKRLVMDNKVLIRHFA